MGWIRTKREAMRGTIETFDQFLERNIGWWLDHRVSERTRRKQYYENFLSFGNVQTTENDIVGEVGPGPFGGIIEVCKLKAKQKVFIDYIMDSLFNLDFIKWPDDAIYVDAPAESIPLGDDVLDILLSYNTLDHGWDIFESLRECVRVSKHCYLAFDCRGDDKNEINIRQGGRDKDHFQLLEYNDLNKFLIGCGYNFQLRNMKLKDFPVAFIEVHK